MSLLGYRVTFFDESLFIIETVIIKNSNESVLHSIVFLYYYYRYMVVIMIFWPINFEKLYSGLIIQYLRVAQFI